MILHLQTNTDLNLNRLLNNYEKPKNDETISQEFDLDQFRKSLKKAPRDSPSSNNLDDSLSKLGSEDERPETQLSSDNQLFERIRKLEQVILNKKKQKQ